MIALVFLGLAGCNDNTPNFSDTRNSIVLENSKPGTNQWDIPGGYEATTEIQAFAGSTSVAPKEKISFYVSVQVPNTLYTISFYRLGWYAGLGGRLMESIPGNVGIAQGYYDAKNKRLVCNSCTIGTGTGLIETHWKSSYTLTVPSDWPTGVYLAKFTDAQGLQTYAPFDVRGSARSTYIVVTPDTTAAAYNFWGGDSLYNADDQLRGTGATVTQGAGVAEVSFDRPYSQDDGAGMTRTFNIQAIRWLEQQGYDLSYISSTDLQANPGQLLTHKAYISIGHDEYWTKEMRDGVEHARDQGVGLAFLSGDTSEWQMRFAPDSAGVANRTIICYKVKTSNGEQDLERDPLYRQGGDNSRVTAEWRDPVVNRPEDEMTGVMHSGLTDNTVGFPWTLDPQAHSSLLQQTGLQPGKSYGCTLVGYEWDRVFNRAEDAPYQTSVPKGIQVLSSSKDINSEDGSTDQSNSIYYIVPSGALVFASGSIQWANALDDYMPATQTTQIADVKAACGGDLNNAKPIPGIQKLMANIMAALILKHPSGNL